jgi:2-polyprenyl-3-methyl-5-hydroxy-6-metoxy-1,4-benzoquinol methylase
MTRLKINRMSDMLPPPTEKIEILSVKLLDEQRLQVEALKHLARSLGIGTGWHYLLDWAWILSLLGSVKGMRIVDAGAGQGLLQWYLAEQGAEVTSVDRSSRAELSLRFRAHYSVSGLAPVDLSGAGQVLRKNIKNAKGVKAKSVSALRGAAGLIEIALPKATPGRVIIYNQDLGNMPRVATNSMDAVVAVSALEHNSPEALTPVVDELMRVLKPGGYLLATLGAASDRDWFHEPSQGWCYTDASLRKLFKLSPEVPSNYSLYDNFISSLRECDELRLNLADFYFHSGNNGLPWGKWDPKYQPVGICKRK